MVFPKSRFSRPACQRIAQHALGLRTDKAEGKRLRVGFPYDSVKRIHQGHVILMRLPQRFFGSLAFDGDAGQMSNLFYHVAVPRGRGSGLAIVHGKGSQHSVFPGEYRRGPACAQAIRQGHVTKTGPERIGGDVRDDHLLCTIGGRST